MVLPKDKGIRFENGYALMESEMIATPYNLIKGLGMRDLKLSFSSDISEDERAQIFQKLLGQKKYNLLLLRDFIAKDQRNFMATGNVNMELRNLFKNVSITDSIVISKRINEVEQYEPSEYSERVLWDYFHDLAKVKKHAFCVSGTLDQIDNLVLLNLKSRKNGDVLQNGSCYFPVKLYEEFFTKIKFGNNVVVF